MAYLYSRFIVPIFEGFLCSGKLVLDVGCGKGGLGAIVKTVPEKDLNPSIIGLDLELGMLKRAKLLYDDVVLASADYLPFRDKAFDAVFSIEVIEHLNERQGHKHVIEIEHVSKGLVVITTPSHFFPQDKIQGSSRTRELMRHKSYWSAKYFKKRGYVVQGLYPVREWIPPLLARKFPYLSCSILAYRVI
ncbi:class I SAM-dependent methyltransferase [Candidatus Methanodesulfokora washburnensis]|jgi:ubiquinone/menaquinone biosynthesis C-methylase UbiE|uniref:Class I SAM-dependent methyltransferase n=1 Tax=Candidatus Methanodesulfokora washburnensis TaxID=2478471 RepID=A0A3R9PI86_9CREN|nr:class I SAM-dependent methyltransferase [Candidatus Methanodesulfokores washburnensis]RSN74938.1 class I SAM-dependent methyltransferase [Candidatus Methanodesulfokores washburnensis]